MPKTLNIPVRIDVFHQIEARETQWEYRPINAYWENKLRDRHYDQIRLYVEYPAQEDLNKAITRPWLGYEVHNVTIPRFGETPTQVFAIRVNSEEELGQDA